jgi:para-aminobenzoate synthetase component 1
VSASPETFLRVRDGRVETYPIKGTRRRGATPEEDRAAARDLAGSEKDRAELAMIVDVERNDLARLCVPGSVRASEARIEELPTVHHLVATVEGRLRAAVGPSALLRAAFPGGSISGAPKLRALAVLRDIEPAARGFFTGSLLWFGDDGSVDSSILIRTATFDATEVTIGAGGGIVADSHPESEWEESNHKVRHLAAALGFEPEQAR